MTFTTRLRGVLTTTLLTVSLRRYPRRLAGPGVVPTAGNTTTARVTKSSTVT